MAMLDLDLPDFSADMCGVTEQMEMLMSPKSNRSSIYLPNMRSRRNTPVPGTPRTPLAKQSSQTGKSKQSLFPSVLDLIDVTSIASREITKGAATRATRTPKVIKDDRSTPTNQISQVPIDVTDLESSKFSQTTVKKVICLDEDSQGNIHTRRKMRAMPKHGRRHVRSPTGRRDEKQRRGAAPGTISDGSVAQHSIVDLNGVIEEEEGEIVFSECPDANKGLFEGIWDAELPNIGSMSKALRTPTSKKDIGETSKTPTTNKEIDLSKLGDDGNESLASSILMSTVSQERDRRGLLGHLLKTRDAMLKAPMLPIDTEGPSSPAASKLESEKMFRHQNRGRDPSAIPWSHPILFSSGSKGQTRDAPMVKTSNQREPEGQGLPAQGQARIENMYSDYSDDDDDNEDDDSNCEEDNGIAHTSSFPRPCRRTSALRLNSVPSLETRSVTFREGKTILGPKSKSEEQPVPDIIQTDCSRGAGSSQRSSATRSVRRNEHPWEDQAQAPLLSQSQSQCSSRRPFHSLSTPSKSPVKDSNQGRPRRIDLLAKARTSRGQTPSVTSKKSASSKKSILGGIYDATLRFPDMIILDVDSDNIQERSPMPDQIEVKVSKDQQQVWDDVSDTLSGSINRNSVVMPANSQKGPSVGATSSRELAREREDHFFDYLCI